MVNKKRAYTIMGLALLGLGASVVLAVDPIGVSGSNTRFAASIEAKVGDNKVKLRLTGTALRKKFVNIYAIGSYLQEGVSVSTAEQLAGADCGKCLHLVMERDVDGKDMAEAFRFAIRQNYPVPQWTDELNSMVAAIQAKDVRKGDHIWLTHVPKVGLHINHVGKTEVLIRNAQFSQAVWNIYLGKNHLGDAIKTGLVSRL
jgi:hypothetical protein